MTQTAQLPLDLDFRPALGGEDFLVAPNNEAAVAWIDRWPDWPGPALAIHGPAGCGKTHLAHVWQAMSGAVLLRAERVAEASPPEMLGGRKACVVEGADDGVDEEALFHLYNWIGEQRGHMLLTGRSAPARWPVALPDLRSRLSSVPAVAVGEPDDALFMAVLVKLFSDRQLQVGEEVIRYMTTRMERSFDAARRAVKSIDSAALAARRGITVPLVRETLGL